MAPSRYRVADGAVFAGEQPGENVLSPPPLIIVEVVSRDDRSVELVEKLEGSRRWGVRHIWLLDRWLRRLHGYGEHGLGETPAFAIPELEIAIFAAEILG